MWFHKYVWKESFAKQTYFYQPGNMSSRRGHSLLYIFVLILEHDFLVQRNSKVCSNMPFLVSVSDSVHFVSH